MDGAGRIDGFDGQCVRTLRSPRIINDQLLASSILTGLGERYLQNAHAVRFAFLSPHLPTQGGEFKRQRCSLGSILLSYPQTK